MTTTTSPRPRKAVSVFAALAVAAATAAAALVAVPAQAAPANGALDWGFLASWRSYVTGPYANGTITASDGARVASDGTFVFTQTTGGDYDPATGDGSIHYDGTVDFVVTAHGIDIALQDPWIDIHDGSATLSAEMSTGDATGTSSLARVDLVDFANADGTVDGASSSWSSLAGIFASTIQPGGISRYAGAASDPASFTFVAPAAPAAATATTVAVGPTAPLVKGASATLTATVANTAAPSGAVPAGGTVQFLDAVAGGAAAPLGSPVPLVGGIATLTTALPAGGNVVTAQYSGATAFAASQSAPAASYGVVDASEPTLCAPAPGSPSATGATASWQVSDYSNGIAPQPAWAKTASGGISLASDGKTFQLGDGVITADASCVSVAFNGSMHIVAAGGFWVQLDDPTLTVAADGAGAWTADVSSGGSADSSAPSERVTVSALSGASLPDVSTAGTASVGLAFAATAAQGSWKAGYSDAWSNAFVLRVPSAVRSFFYASGSTLDPKKAPAAISLSWPAVAGAGDPGQGEPGTGDPGTGDPGTGSPGTGDPGAGIPQLTAGGLGWGFLSSWRAYLGMFGTTTVSGGVTKAADGTFTFPQAVGGDFDPRTGEGTIRFAGAVDFASAAHGFDIALRDPYVTIAGTTATLSAETSTSDTAGTSAMSRITVATADLSTATRGTSGADLLWTGARTSFAPVLQPGGWSPYQGTAADPISIRYGAPVTTPAPSVSASVGTVAAGGTISFGATGLQPGSVVTAVVHSEPVQLGAKTVGFDGGVRYDWAVPLGFEAGAHTIEILQNGVVVASTGFTVTAAAAAAPASGALVQVCAARTVSAATLDWGVKASFRDYIVGGIANGAISVSGARETADGFEWSKGSGTADPKKGIGRVSYSGSVHFTGHDGALDLTLSNPVISLTSSSHATLYADVRSTALDTGAVTTQSKVALADIALRGQAVTGSDTISVSAAPATLTSAGASAFAGFYNAGDALDPVSFTLPLGGNADCALASTGSDLQLPMSLASALLLFGALALAFTRARARRRTVAPSEA